MIIISDCLSERPDEGCIKVASNLIKRLKKQSNENTVISYKGATEISDIHLNLNKLFLSKKLFSIIRKKNEPILYVPFASNTKASIIRTFILSRMSRRQVSVLFALRFKMDAFSSFLLKMSGARVISLSKDSYDFYHEIATDRTTYLKCGVDVNKFVPADTEKKEQLRKKYGIEDEKKVILHVGHLNMGRGVDKLLNIDDSYRVFLILSSVTKDMQDADLRKKLEEKSNITIIEGYVENIEELYQIADVYFFPVLNDGSCIDVPLSVLEAAACNIRILATRYREIMAFPSVDGFMYIDDFETNALNRAISDLIYERNVNTRQIAMEYDWENSTQKLMSVMNE